MPGLEEEKPKLYMDVKQPMPTAQTALLLIDMINDLEFDGGEDLLEHTLPILPPLKALKAKCKSLGIPCIYVNDNFGHWQADFNKLVDHCLHDGVRGQPLAEALRPEADDFFVLKPKHSGFYLTSLNALLKTIGAKKLIITGVAGDICVIFTANDAYMRNYDVYIPQDCTASESEQENQNALQLMVRSLKARICPADELKLEEMV